MKSLDVKVEPRKELGKKFTKQLRKELMVPCVMYGGNETIHFYAHENEFKDLIYTPNVYLVNLDVGGKKFKAVLKDIQFHPVTDKVLHMDFVEVVDGKPVTITMPVELTGSSEGIKNGGKLRFRRRHLKVKALAEKIPDSLQVDITPLKINDTFQIKDLDFGDVELIGPENAMVVGVISSRAAAKGMELEDPTAEGEEGGAAAEGAEATPEEGGGEEAKEE